MSLLNPIKKFEIHLEHDIDEQYQYEPGEVIRGKILLSAQDDIRIKGIQLQVRGEATVAWDEEGGQFSTSETYVDDTVDILGGRDVNIVSVTRGQHSYPIEYILPQDLPSSFIGKFGSITYVMKATLKEDNRFGFGAVITSEPFLVLRGLDVFGQPELQTTKKIVLSKAPAAANCFRICDFGKATGEFTVSRTGFLPGDDVMIDAEILNSSARSVTSIQASLVLNSTFHAKNKARRHCQIVAKKTDSCDVDDGDVRHWTAVKLAVPPYIPESRLDGCDMIDIDYELQFRVEIDGGGAMRGSLPVMIGTPTDEKKRAERRTWKLDEANGNGNEDDEFHEEIMHKFRHPMEEGETRVNILFDDESVVGNSFRQIPNNRWSQQDKSPYTMTQDNSPYTMTQDKSPYTMTQDKSPYTMSHDNNYGQSIAEDNYGRSTAEENYGRSIAEDNYGRSTAEDNYGRSTAKDNYGGSTAEDNYGRSTAEDNYGRSIAEDNYGQENTYRQSVAEDSNPYSMAEGQISPQLNEEDNYRQSMAEDNPYNMAEGSNPYKMAGGSNPYNMAEGQNPYNMAEGQNPYNMAEGHNPYNTEEGHNPYNTEESHNPYNTEEGHNPYNTEEGHNPYNTAEDSNPYTMADNNNPYLMAEDEPRTIEEGETLQEVPLDDEGSELE